MKTSLMVFHPHMEQSRVNRTLMQTAQSLGSDNLIVRDMYALYPDFHIDVAHEQRINEECDRLVFQFPFYWYSAPALMKQWEDEVLSSGWAYGPDARIAGKKMMLAISTGGASQSYSLDGKHHATMDELLAPYRIIAQYLGLEFEQPFIIYNSYSSDLTDERLQSIAHDFINNL